ncbi:hypothetical protein [Flavobacterium sp. PS2]|uniref:hypothetical protein n=1 Tax=Flavobacterium sp. PS2 TaxID=3384157 RepID=UPI00390C9ED9
MIRRKLYCLFFILFISFTTYASSQSDKLEKQKFEFEKLNEKRKAEYELIKALITGFSLLIPLLLGIYTVRSQIKSARELKKIESENLFALKAAEIVMSAKNAHGIKSKAEVLLAIFKDRLPENFISSFDPKNYHNPGPSSESKLELLKLINNNPEKEEDIVKLWLRMYPGDSIEKLFPGDLENT